MKKKFNIKDTNKNKNERKRVRELGLELGLYETGKYNSITDVEGVLVGHSTITQGSGKLISKRGPVRTGVTAILPSSGDVYLHRVVGGGFVLNGAGEVSGLTQVMEWGLIETPILLTNSLSVGTCSEALVHYMTEKYPEIGTTHDVVLPLVGECDDSWLNDISGRHVREKHVFEAIKNAKSGVIEEGCVGGGTGMITCDFKGGIGTSSRQLPKSLGGYVVGILVMSNFGHMTDLKVDGIPVGKVLSPHYHDTIKRQKSYGSIIAVMATNAPLLPHQINRLCKRVSLGIGRVGSYAAHGSGEIILGFSTANKVPREGKKHLYRMDILMDEAMDPLYQAVIEATEESILNSMCMATDMLGVNDHFCPAIPLEPLEYMIQKRIQFQSEADYHLGPVI